MQSTTLLPLESDPALASSRSSEKNDVLFYRENSFLRANHALTGVVLCFNLGRP